MRLRAPMPGDETQPQPRARGWLLAVLPIAAYALLVLIEMPLDARQPTGYIKFHLHGPWIYPTREVIVCMAIVFCQALLVIALLAARTETSLGGRAFLLSILLGSAAFCFSPLAMHADSTIGNTLDWSFVAVFWLFVCALASGLHAIVVVALRQVKLWQMSRGRRA
ncbi:MAG TPA: hypothetical protein VGG28_09640 [Kofleriaceae bacterium]|jgi:hypothetical protein